MPRARQTRHTRSNLLTSGSGGKKHIETVPTEHYPTNNAAMLVRRSGLPAQNGSGNRKQRLRRSTAGQSIPINLVIVCKHTIGASRGDLCRNNSFAWVACSAPKRRITPSTKAEKRGRQAVECTQARWISPGKEKQCTYKREKFGPRTKGPARPRSI